VGIEQWTENNRSLVGKDLVLWHTMGVTHIPRPEDFPVMCVSSRWHVYLSTHISQLMINDACNRDPPPSCAVPLVCRPCEYASFHLK
jgi:Copper amine oxidase, enzyme domain